MSATNRGGERNDFTNRYTQRQNTAAAQQRRQAQQQTAQF